MALLALTQPPLVYILANRIQPWMLGVPFLYADLLVIYLAMIAVPNWGSTLDGRSAPRI